MPVLTCSVCGHEVGISMVDPYNGQGAHDILRIVMVCQNEIGYRKPCEARTVFEIKGQSTTFAPGKLLGAPISKALSPDVLRLFEEAVLCFYGQATRGVVAMCRSAIEALLDEKKAQGDDLYKKIAWAESQTPPLIKDDEDALAQGVRLIGRNALHRLAPVSQAQALAVLNVTLDLLNAVNGRTPKPALP